jgi:hypothetical protein
MNFEQLINQEPGRTKHYEAAPRKKLSQEELYFRDLDRKQERERNLRAKAQEVRPFVQVLNSIFANGREHIDEDSKRELLIIFVNWSTQYGYKDEKLFEWVERDMFNFARAVYNSYLKCFSDCGKRLTSKFKRVKKDKNLTPLEVERFLEIWHRENAENDKKKLPKQYRNYLRIQSIIDSFVASQLAQE